MKNKIEKLLVELNKGLVGKEKIIKLGLLSLLAKENLILVGPPGTAKSEISRRITKILKNGDNNYFEYLLTKFTTPEEIFGPLSIKKLQEDRFERNIEGYMPKSKIVFLDEIFKANSAILNTLLTMVNERVYHNGSKKENVPLISLIGASNELPIGNEELMALYDRFLLRGIVNYVEDDLIEELIEVENSIFEIDDSLKISDKELEKIQTESKNVKISSNVKKAIMEIRIEYNKEFFENKFEILSDRKVVKIVKLLKISAYINGRDKVDFSDLILMANCLWNDIENSEKVTKIVLDIVKRYIGKEENI